MHLVQAPLSTLSSPREVVVETSPAMTPSAEGNLKILHVIEANAEVMCCRFNIDGNLLGVGLSSGTIKVYAVDSGHCVYSLSDSDTAAARLPVTSLRWKAVAPSENFKNILLATYANGNIKHWHVSTSTCLSTVTESDHQVLACSFNASANKFVTGGSNSKLNVYDEKTKKIVCTLGASSSHLVMDGHMSRVFVVHYTPGDDNVFLSGGWDDTVQFWDTRVNGKHSVRKIFGPHLCGDALDIQLSNLNILTGSWRKDNVLQIWDYGTGKLIRDVSRDYSNSMLYCVQWQDSDCILAGGSDSNMMRCVDQGTLHTTGRLVDLDRAVYTLDHNRHSSHSSIAVGTNNFVYFVKRT